MVQKCDKAPVKFGSFYPNVWDRFHTFQGFRISEPSTVIFSFRDFLEKIPASLTLKIEPHPKRKRSCSKLYFAGASCNSLDLPV